MQTTLETTMAGLLKCMMVYTNRIGDETPQGRVAELSVPVVSLAPQPEIKLERGLKRQWSTSTEHEKPLKTVKVVTLVSDVECVDLTGE